MDFTICIILSALLSAYFFLLQNILSKLSENNELVSQDRAPFYAVYPYDVYYIGECLCKS